MKCDAALHDVVARIHPQQDAARALGYLHAQDRFFQMDMIRRTLSGRLAETVGVRKLGPRGHAPLGPHSTTADADRLMRCMDLGRAADAYTWFQRAVAREPWDPTFQVNLGMSLASVGKMQEAAQAHRAMKASEHFGKILLAP